MNFINVDNFYFLQLRRTGVFHSLVVKDGLFYLSDVYMDEIRIKITCSNIPKSRETLVNQGFSAHKKITVPTAPMSVKTVIASARSGVRTLDTLIKRHSNTTDLRHVVFSSFSFPTFLVSHRR